MKDADEEEQDIEIYITGGPIDPEMLAEARGLVDEARGMGVKTFDEFKQMAVEGWGAEAAAHYDAAFREAWEPAKAKPAAATKPAWPWLAAPKPAEPKPAAPKPAAPGWDTTSLKMAAVEQARGDAPREGDTRVSAQEMVDTAFREAWEPKAASAALKPDVPKVTFDARGERAMRVAGWTLTVMAVVLHFSACEWDDRSSAESCVVPFLPFVHAREHFRQGRTSTFNTTGAALWGLVIPIGLVVAGISLIRRDPRPTVLRRVVGWVRRAIVNSAVPQAQHDDPKNALAYCRRGRAYYDKGDFDKAITVYTEAIRLDPTCALAYFNRGWAYKQKREATAAAADFAKAKELGLKL